MITAPAGLTTSTGLTTTGAGTLTVAGKTTLGGLFALTAAPVPVTWSANMTFNTANTIMYYCMSEIGTPSTWTFPSSPIAGQLLIIFNNGTGATVTLPANTLPNETIVNLTTGVHMFTYNGSFWVGA